MRLNIANIFCCFSLLVVCICNNNNGCDAFGLGSSSNNNKMPVTTSTNASSSRQNFLAVVMAAAVATPVIAIASPTAAWAAKEEVKKGSKDDPAVQAKMSVCVYECTKPKGSEQMTRVECIKKCKTELITSKRAPVAAPVE